MEGVASRKVVAVMSDLFFLVKINDAAKKSGMSVSFVKDKTVALEKIRSGADLVILDLNCGSASPLELIRLIKSEPETASIRTVGFVSHVRTDLRQSAVEAGCDLVVPRSVFAERLGEILSG